MKFESIPTRNVSSSTPYEHQIHQEAGQIQKVLWNCKPCQIVAKNKWLVKKGVVEEGAENDTHAKRID